LKLLKHRVIPALLLRDGGLVKTRRFKDAKYVGDPINAIRIFNDKEVDELMVFDIVASKRGQEPDYAMIELFAGECFMPLCYGGGVSSVEQAARIFDLGVEKISLQSAALDDLEIISRIAERFGNQSVVVSVDVKRNWLKGPQLFESRSGKMHKLAWLDFAQHAIAAGAGEVLINAVDRDGEMQGMDLELIRQASTILAVPLIALGGVGSLQHIKDAVNGGASAVAAGAFFVFHGPHRAVLITYPLYQELEVLLSNR
jgi:cyclase